jgi:DNA repair protein NreA
MFIMKKTVYSKPFNLVYDYNYPNLLVGPGFYSNYYSAKQSTPKEWIKNKNLSNICNFRQKQEFTLKKYNKNDTKKGNKYLEEIQLLTQSIKTTEIEIDFYKKINIIKDNISGINNFSYKLEKFKIYNNITVPRNIDKIVNDCDLKAKDGVISLYSKTKDIYKTQQLLSIGLLGVKKDRTLVPTRWAITSCDDINSKYLISEKIKYYSKIDCFKIFNYSIYKNQFVILFIPDNWGFEVIEKQGDNYNIDYELNNPKKKYARFVCGGYYSTRLEITNYLEHIKKQAKIIIFRYIEKDYNSIGVWVIREAIKESLLQKPIIFNNLEDSLNYIQSNFKKVNIEFIKKSNIIKELKIQRKITSFI